MKFHEILIIIKLEVIKMNLKKLRIEQQKTQKEVAQAIDITQFTYSNYEIGKTQPDIETLKKLAKYFHTTIDNLVDNETPYLIDKSQFTQTQLNIIEQIKSLQEETCQKIEAYIIGLKSAEEEKQRIINMYSKRS